MKNKNSKKSNTLALETPLTVDIDTGIEKDIDVLGLIKWDWANSGFRYTQALRKLGLNARSFKGTPLAYFNYPKQLPTLDILSKVRDKSSIDHHKYYIPYIRTFNHI